MEMLNNSILRSGVGKGRGILRRRHLRG